MTDLKLKTGKKVTMGAEMDIILIYLLLALASVLIISVIVLAIYVERLRRSVALMRSDPVTLVLKRPINPEDKGKPIVRRPRPPSGTCSFKSGSMESVFYVPSRTGSPEVFRKSDIDDVELACTATKGTVFDLFVANTAAGNAVMLPTD